MLENKLAFRRVEKKLKQTWGSLCRCVILSTQQLIADWRRIKESGRYKLDRKWEL